MRARLLFSICLALAVLFLVVHAAAAQLTSGPPYSSCFDLGFAAGSCSLDTCGAQQGCYCNTAPNTHLCCIDQSASPPMSTCYDKATGGKVVTTLSAPADATFVAVPEPASTHKLVYFIPSVSIPFSDKFNQGEKIVLTGETLGEYISALYFFLCSIAGILATVMMMWGGIRYVTSFGNPQGISSAKDTITSAMLGLAIALGAYVILLTINPNLVAFKGLSVTEIKETEEGYRSAERMSYGLKSGASYRPVDTNVSQFDAWLTLYARQNRIDRNYLKAIMLVESSGNPLAESSPLGEHACGLMQLLPSTANKSCDELKSNPELSISLAAQYFRTLLDNPCPTQARTLSDRIVPCYPERTNCQPQDYHYALAAYNGGISANCNSRDCPDGKVTWWECTVNGQGYKETRDYVPKVEDAVEKIKNNSAFAWTVSPA